MIRLVALLGVLATAGCLEPAPRPIVLAHGFGGNGATFDDSIVSALEARGHAVVRTEVPSVESVAVRAEALGGQLDEILAEHGAGELHIIAHSMGGLDSRYAISTLGYGDRVRSLSTISTPHRGSPIADASLWALGREDDPYGAIDAIVALVGDVDPDALRRNLIDLSEAEAGAFNAANPDVAGVHYQSFSGLGTLSGALGDGAGELCAGSLISEPPVPMFISSLLLLAAPFAGDAATDGVVPVSSARWGDFRGCFASDHILETKANAMGLYLRLADQVAALE